MGVFACNMLSYWDSISTCTFEITRTHRYPSQKNSSLQNPTNFRIHKLHFRPLLVATKVEATEKIEIVEEDRPKFRWVEIGPEITESQKQAISQLPPKMTKRCKALNL